MRYLFSETGHAAALTASDFMAIFTRFSSSILPKSVRDRLERLYGEWATVKLDGKVTVAELVTFVQGGIREAMELVAELGDDTVKKQIVMEFAGALYDLFAPYLKQTWLGWLLSFFGEDVLRQRFLDAINLLIEVFYQADFRPLPDRQLRMPGR